MTADHEIDRLMGVIDAAHGLICNAHQKRVDDVTNEDGASPGWAEAARRWIDAYPPVAAVPVSPVSPAPDTCREALDRSVPPAAAATSTATDSAREAVSDGSGARESSSADGGHTVTEQWDAHGGDVVWRSCSCGERWTNDVETCPEAPMTTANPADRLRLAADELERDGRWGAAADATTALAAWMRAEADRPERRAWDDQVLHLAADLADHILGEVDR